MVRYLVAVDEHDCSQRAVEKVLLLAKPKDVVYLLHVDHKKTPDLESAKQHYDDAEMGGSTDDLINCFARKFQEKEVECTSLVKHGADIKEEIITEANILLVDFIVVGTRGRSKLHRYQKNSVHSYTCLATTDSRHTGQL